MFCKMLACKFVPFYSLVNHPDVASDKSNNQQMQTNKHNKQTKSITSNKQNQCNQWSNHINHSMHVHVHCVWHVCTACVVCLCMCMCTSCHCACMHACLYVCCVCTCWYVHICFSQSACAHMCHTCEKARHADSWQSVCPKQQTFWKVVEQNHCIVLSIQK